MVNLAKGNKRVTAPLYELSVHAKVVMSERAIEVEWLERVLAQPERTEDDLADAELRHAIGRIREYGDRYLRVIYNPNVAPWRVVTVYFDRSLKGTR
jgi:hypothetical protein